MRVSEMTPWFPPHIKPVHDGVYEVSINPSAPYRRYALWEEKRWWEGSHSVDTAAKNRHYGFQFWLWRGLAKEPQ